MFDNDPDLVDHVVDMSTSGRAPSNAYAVAALAIAGTVQNPTTKQRVVDALPRVARTGSDFLRFVSLSAGFRRSWPRSLRRAVSNWFLAQTPERLALQVTTYFQREGYTMRDVLRLSHVMSALRRLRRRRDIPPETAERLFGVLYIGSPEDGPASGRIPIRIPPSGRYGPSSASGRSSMIPMRQRASS
jgi:60 kDa SS-A/Ro ribonucleoprotein